MNFYIEETQSIRSGMAGGVVVGEQSSRSYNSTVLSFENWASMRSRGARSLVNGHLKMEKFFRVHIL